MSDILISNGSSLFELILSKMNSPATSFLFKIKLPNHRDQEESEGVDSVDADGPVATELCGESVEI